MPQRLLEVPNTAPRMPKKPAGSQGGPKTERGDSLTEGVLKVGAGVGAALQMLVPGGMQGHKAVVVSAPTPPAAVGGFVAVSYGAPALRS